MKTEIAIRRFWYAARALWWKGYWSMKIDGLENVPREGPMLLCGNHASHLDAPAILAALPLDLSMRAFTAAARDVFYGHPLRNFAGRLATNCLPIERFAGFSRGLRELEEVLLRGHPLVVFPEGRRSRTGALLKFSDGPAMLSLRTGAPLVPIHLDGMLGALKPGAVWPSPTRVRIRFGRPIDPAPHRPADDARDARRTAYQRLTRRLRDAVEALAEPPRSILAPAGRPAVLQA